MSWKIEIRNDNKSIPLLLDVRCEKRDRLEGHGLMLSSIRFIRGVFDDDKDGHRTAAVLATAAISNGYDIPDLGSRVCEFTASEFKRLG